MNTSSSSTMPPERDDDERDLAALLQAAGPRDQASDEMRAQVQSAVASEWRATVAARQRRRRFVPLLAVASVATLAVATWLSQPLLRQETGPVATVALVNGTVQVRHEGTARWLPLAATDTINAGDTLQTATAGRVALRLHDGVEVRLDSRTELTLADAGSARLESGGVYVDANSAAHATGGTFVLETTAGDVRHLGTQYAVRTLDGTVLVNVREGSVAIERGRDRIVGNAGEQLSLTAGGTVVRTTIAPRDTQWAWVEAIAPPFAIEGRPLDDFLGWAARETGRQLVYTSQRAATEASVLKLRGSIEGLGPDAAVAAVFTTTPTLRATVGDTHIRVEHVAEGRLRVE